MFSENFLYRAEKGLDRFVNFMNLRNFKNVFNLKFKFYLQFQISKNIFILSENLLRGVVLSNTKTSMRDTKKTAQLNFLSIN